jgi:LysR family transcriptional activator of nhaA
VAREGGVARASVRLHLSAPAVSGQVRQLERSLGEKLFRKSGRGLELTEMGRLVYRYADEIFALGRELQDMLEARPTGRPARLLVGVDEVLPKLIVRRLLAPALALPEDVHLVCREARAEELLAGLADHRFDVVLSDTPVGAGSRVKAYSHLLGECGVSWLATPKLANAHRRGFPGSLDGAPLLLPTDNTALRRALEPWFERLHIKPHIVGEFEDSALLKAFGQDGAGIFPAPTAIEKEVARQYDVHVVGRSEDVRERFYALSVERRLHNPAVVAICEAARAEIFAV